MTFEINETASLMVQRSLQLATKNVESSMVKLSYGKQTKAMENAANMMISESLEAQRRGSQQASRNLQDGLNMLATAESGLASQGDNLQRIRELAIQRNNDTYSEEDKKAIDAEISALTEEIDRTSKTTSFNGKQLLDGSSEDAVLQSGANADPETNTIKAGSTLKESSSGTMNLDPSSPDFLNNIDSALKDVNSKRSEIGAMQNRIESGINSLQIQNENMTAAQSRIIDTDVATEVSKLTQNQILQEASGSLLAQANQSASIANLLI